MHTLMFLLFISCQHLIPFIVTPRLRRNSRDLIFTTVNLRYRTTPILFLAVTGAEFEGFDGRHLEYRDVLRPSPFIVRDASWDTRWRPVAYYRNFTKRLFFEQLLLSDITVDQMNPKVRYLEV